MTREVFKKIAYSGGAGGAQAAAALAVNIFGPGRTLIRNLMNEVPFECLDKLPSDEDGSRAMLALSRSLGAVDGLASLDFLKRPLVAVEMDGTAVSGQVLLRARANGLFIPTGIVLDSTDPVSGIIDEDTANRAFFDADGKPRLRYTQGVLLVLNSQQDGVPPLPLSFIGIRPGNDNLKFVETAVQSVFRVVDQNGGRFVGPAGDGSTSMEQYFQKNNLLVSADSALPQFYIAVSFEDGSCVYASLILSSCGNYFHCLIADSDTRHVSKKLKVPLHRLNRSIAFGPFSVALGYALLMHVHYPRTSGIRRDYYDTSDKQSVEAAQHICMAEAQEAATQLLHDPAREQGYCTQAFSAWQVHLDAFNKGFLDYDLEPEARFVLVFGALCFVQAHRFYCKHHEHLSWSVNGICSETAFRDLRYDASRLALLLAYIVVENIQLGYGPCDGGSNNCELSFNYARTSTGQSEVSFEAARRSFMRYYASLLNRASSLVRDAPSNRKNEGETWGNRSALYDASADTLASVNDMLQRAALKARDAVIQQFSTLGISIPLDVVKDAAPLPRLIVRHPTSNFGDDHVVGSFSESNINAGGEDELDDIDLDDVAEIINEETLLADIEQKAMTAAVQQASNCVPDSESTFNDLCAVAAEYFDGIDDGLPASSAVDGGIITSVDAASQKVLLIRRPMANIVSHLIYCMN